MQQSVALSAGGLSPRQAGSSLVSGFRIHLASVRTLPVPPVLSSDGEHVGCFTAGGAQRAGPPSPEKTSTLKTETEAEEDRRDESSPSDVINICCWAGFIWSITNLSLLGLINHLISASVPEWKKTLQRIREALKTCRRGHFLIVSPAETEPAPTTTTTTTRGTGDVRPDKTQPVWIQSCSCGNNSCFSAQLQPRCEKEVRIYISMRKRNSTTSICSSLFIDFLWICAIHVPFVENEAERRIKYKIQQLLAEICRMLLKDSSLCFKCHKIEKQAQDFWIFTIKERSWNSS